MKVAVDKIVINSDRLRSINFKKVTEIAESIKTIGQIQPIILKKEDNTLIAGEHRLEAIKELGRKEIEAEYFEDNDLKAKLLEIDENLCRSEVHYLERAQMLMMRKEILCKLEGKEQDINKNSSSFQPVPFTKDMAEKLNISQRTVQHEMQMAKNLTPEAKKAVKDNNISKRNALELARLPSSEQNKIIEKGGERIEIENLIQQCKQKARDGTLEDSKLFMEVIKNASSLKTMIERLPKKNEYLTDDLKRTLKSLDEAIKVLLL